MSRPDWPFYGASVQHQVDVMVQMLRRGLDPERMFVFFDAFVNHDALLVTARDIAAGD